MIRFKILLPQFYNDGRPVEPDKYLATDDELVRQFGATSTDSVVVRGRWLYQSTLYSDQLVGVGVDADDTQENWEAMRRAKETFKARFEQLDIWITAHRIAIV